MSHDFQEANTGVIEMSNNPPQAVRALINWLYTHDYFADTVFEHAEIYIIAGVYMAPELMNLAYGKFHTLFKSRHHDGGDIYMLLTLIESSLPESDRIVLRSALEFYCASHLSALLLDPQFVAAFAENEDFRTEVAIKNYRYSKLFEPPSCDWQSAILGKALREREESIASGRDSD
ncbi:hypothetical protein BKA80DRAFT_345940 [Phyllosticta citrichinensis]